MDRLNLLKGHLAPAETKGKKGKKKEKDSGLMPFWVT